VSEYTVTVSELEDFRLDLEDAVKEALGPNPQRVKGSWCRFAKCKTRCPLHVSSAVGMAALGEKLGKLKAQHEFSASETNLNANPMVAVSGVEAEEYTADYAEALSMMLQLGEILEPYIKEAQSQAHTFMEAGGKVPGFKLVPKRAGWDKWKEDRTKVDRFLANQGLDLDARREPWEPISPAQARTKLKALGKDMKEGSKDRKLLDKYIAPGVSSGSTLAPSDDPRPEITNRAETVKELAGKLTQLSAN
jgi:hypothetical protein